MLPSVIFGTYISLCNLNVFLGGGRRTQHLGELVPVANTYANVIIIVGNNDVGTLTDWQIIQNLRNFLENLRPGITVLLCGFLPRLDHELEYNFWSNS